MAFQGHRRGIGEENVERVTLSKKMKKMKKFGLDPELEISLSSSTPLGFLSLSWSSLAWERSTHLGKEDSHMSDPTGSAPNLPPTPPLTDTATPSTTAYAASQMSAGMTSNGTPNAQSTVNGDTDTSKSMSMRWVSHRRSGLDTEADDDPSIDPTFFALNLSSYLFNVGYLGSHWADIHLTFFDTGVNLHRSRSRSLHPGTFGTQFPR